MDINRRKKLIHNQKIFAEAISVELTRLLERALLPEEAHIVRNVVVCQGFMSSEADANGLHFSHSAAEAVRYLTHATSLTLKYRDDVAEEILKGVDNKIRLGQPIENHPDLISWQEAIVDQYLNEWSPP